MLALANAIGSVLDTSAVDAPIGPGLDTSVDGANGSVKGVSGSGSELLSLELVGV